MLGLVQHPEACSFDNGFPYLQGLSLVPHALWQDETQGAPLVDGHPVGLARTGAAAGAG
jgi:hypothetical protein